jgi:dienelactone hydrolase
VWTPRHCAKTFKETPLHRTVSFPTAIVLTLWCAARTLLVDALAGPLERVEFEGASQRLISGGLIRGDRIPGYLAKPEGAGPFPAVIGLHGCAGMSDTTKQKLVGELVGWGYVVLLVDSFATRGVDHDCFKGILAIARMADALGALAFLAGQTFVDPQRVAAVGFSKGAWTALALSESDSSFNLFDRPSNSKFRAAVAFNPPCRDAGARPLIPTIILIGTLDDWTPAAHCSEKTGAWGTDGVPIDLVVYPNVHHGFYYPELQPGRTMLGRWLEYNEQAATDASRRMREFLNRHLN